MKIPAEIKPVISVLLLTFLQAVPLHSASGDIPDFTQGDPIPTGADHDWNLGATGARGWMFSKRLTTSEARQIKITAVDEGSPADNILKVGDVLVGVAGQPFSHDPRTELGKALTLAESETGGALRLTRWRDGATEEVALKLPLLGTYSATAPYDCPKSRRILENGGAALAARMALDHYPKSKGINPITRSLNALALLASGKESYLPLLKREAQWAASYETTHFESWWYGYVATMLAEYIIATGDESVLPGLRRIAIEISKGQSIVGSWSHGFAAPDGRASSYGMMNSPGQVLTIGLVLAREAGVDDPEVAEAVERSIKMLRFYIDKGGVPYGDHAPWTQTHHTNGKNGMAAVIFDLSEEKDGVRFFSRMSTASHGNERDGGHTGNFFNLTWAMPGISRAGPHATGAWMEEFGAWYFDLARKWDGSFPHQGPPAPHNDKYGGWDASGAYLLAYAMPLKKTRLTGSQPSLVEPLDPQAAQQIVRDGRGWSNLHRIKAYDEFGSDTLFTLLGNWSPVVRERAATVLARRDENPLPALVKMLDSGSLEARLGACQALASLGENAAPAVPSLRKTLEADELWLRVKAAEALASIGQPAVVALPQMLKMVIEGPTEQDPRGMEQRYLSMALFGNMLRCESLESVDCDLMREAVAASLRNQDGRARSSVGTIFDRLTYEEIKPLLPAILEAVAEPAPSGIMFANVVRLQGLKVLAQHRIREGLPYCLSFIDIHNWGKRERIKGCLEAVGLYGGAAKPLLPALDRLEKDLLAHREAKGLTSEIERLRTLIKEIENTTDIPKLRSLSPPMTDLTE